MRHSIAVILVCILFGAAVISINKYFKIIHIGTVTENDTSIQ